MGVVAEKATKLEVAPSERARRAGTAYLGLVGTCRLEGGTWKARGTQGLAERGTGGTEVQSTDPPDATPQQVDPQPAT